MAIDEELLFRANRKTNDMIACAKRLICLLEMRQPERLGWFDAVKANTAELLVIWCADYRDNSAAWRPDIAKTLFEFAPLLKSPPLELALNSIVGTVRELEDFADQARSMNATLHVNFGTEGRIAKLLQPSDRGERALVVVLEHLLAKGAANTASGD